MVNKAKNYLDLGRLALNDPEMYIDLYASDRREMCEKMKLALDKKDVRKAISKIRTSLFGHFVQIYYSDFLSNVQFLKLCAKIDELNAALVGTSIKDGEAALDEMQDMIEQTLNIIHFLNTLGGFDAETMRFMFDGEMIRQRFKDELGDKQAKKVVPKEIRKLMKFAASKAPDDRLEWLVDDSVKKMVSSLCKHCSEQEIRNTTDGAERFFTEEYNFVYPFLGKINCVVKDPINTSRYYRSRLRWRQERFNRLSEMGAPVLILVREYRLVCEYETFMLLSEYTKMHDEMTEDNLRFVGDVCEEMFCLVSGDLHDVKKERLEEMKTKMDILREKLRAGLSENIS